MKFEIEIIKIENGYTLTVKTFGDHQTFAFNNTNKTVAKVKELLENEESTNVKEEPK